MSWTESLGRIAAQLTNHRPSLYPTEELDDLMDLKISKLSTDAFEGERRSFALAVKAGLHLFNESLDHSHNLSQNLDTPEGSYWHGIMHRMEGDYPNAAYWFRTAGGHPAHQAWSERIRERVAAFNREDIGSPSFREAFEQWTADGRFEPVGFNRLIEMQVTRTRNERVEQLLMDLQWEEMRTLLQRCYALSGGGGDLFEPR